MKIMLSGDVTTAVTVEGLSVTKGARSAIEAAGGKVIDAIEKPKGKKVKQVKKEASA